MSSKYTLISLAGSLLFAGLLLAGDTPDGAQAVASALDRLRRTGTFNHPDYPYVIRARRVQGDKLFFVEFLHRRKDGNGFDAVGKAVWATLGQPKRSKPDSMPVRTSQMEMCTDDLQATWDDRVEDFPLPTRLEQ